MKKSKALKRGILCKKRWRLAVLIICSLQFQACQQKPEVPANISPVRVEDDGNALHRVRLTAKRAEELGVKTALVREEGMSGKLRKVIPATAVVHDQQGNAWVFKNPDSLVYIRERISIYSIDHDLVILADGPPSGTKVVIAGASELFADASDKEGEGTVDSGSREGGEKKSSGTATMLEDGTIKLVYQSRGTTGFTASVVVEYKPDDEDYQKIIEQVGGLKVGETKSIPTLVDE